MTTLKLFPECKDVFFDDLQQHIEYLLPLASFQIASETGHTTYTMHFVSPIEPYDGLVGEDTTPYHNHYCRPNWIAYSLIENKIRFLSDYGFFRKRYLELHADYKETFQGVAEYLDSLPAALSSHYAKTKGAYEDKKAGYISGNIPADFFSHELYLGGNPTEGNWSECSELPLERVELVQGSKMNRFYYPLTEDNRKFRYIGSIESQYFGCNSCNILLFFDEPTGTILNTFEWS